MAGETTGGRAVAIQRLELRSSPAAIHRRFAGFAWFAAAALLVFIAVTFAERRLAGALVAPLGGFEYLGAASALTLLVAALQFGKPGDVAARSVLAAAGGLALAAITLPATQPWSAGLAWFLFTSGQAAVFLAPQRRWANPARSMQTRSPNRAQPAVDQRLVQRITRERGAAGIETLTALIRVTCSAGEQLAVAHLAFCPPLESTPKLSARVLEPTGVAASITFSENYGARIEVRLPQPAQCDRSVLLEITGEARPDQPAGD